MQIDIQTRHISRLARNTLALILAGGRGARLHDLTQWRAKPAVHFRSINAWYCLASPSGAAAGSVRRSSTSAAASPTAP